MLTFNLTSHWYQKILSGEKHIEYRVVKPYWTTRLAHACQIESGFPQKEGSGIDCQVPCCIKKGYTKESITRTIVRIVVTRGENTDLAYPGLVYALYLQE